MSFYIVKVIVTTLLIVAISELSKRSSFIGALLASIPLISVLAMIWLYAETQDTARVSALSYGVFWLVLPSLALFIALPLLLKQGINFYPAMGIAIGVTIGCYWGMVSLLGYYGVRL